MGTALAGKWPRQNFGNYFSYVVYVEAVEAQITSPSGKSRKGSAHRYHLVQTDEYAVKNQREREWFASDAPDYLTNISFDQLIEALDEADTKAHEIWAKG